MPDRFQDALDQATARLAAATATVSQLEAGVTAAHAGVKKSEADTAASKAELDTALALRKASAGAIAKLKVTEAEQGYRAAQADDRVKEATLKQAQASLAAAKHSVDVAQAALSTAKFNRERCTYVSTVDGQVVNWQIREGTPMARWRFTSNGTVQDFADTAVIAVFPQNLLKNVKAGNEVEIAFKRRPGQIATGKVETVIKYTGEGQMVPSSKLPSAASFGSKGYLAARIRLDDEQLARELPLGAAGTTAIYTDVGKPSHVITKITVRIKAWISRDQQDRLENEGVDVLGGLIGYIACNNAKPTADAKAAPAENEHQTADAQAAPTTDDTAPGEQPKSESVATDASSADEAEPPTQPAEQVAQETFRRVICPENLAPARFLSLRRRSPSAFRPICSAVGQTS